MALELGSRLGHYDVTALIGEGGMGPVYRAREFGSNFSRIVLVASLMSVSLSGCGSSGPAEPDDPLPVDPAAEATSGLAAAERFMETWNTRDPVAWASALNFPHARPSARGLRVWKTESEYVASADDTYARAVATGWDHTEFEDLRLVHDGDTKAHIAGRWARFDANGNIIRHNLVTYIATEIDGDWGIQARFGAGLIRLFQLGTRCCGFASVAYRRRSRAPRIRRDGVGRCTVPSPSRV